MNKTTLLILIATTSSVIAANEVTTVKYNPKPMVEGNRRVDELIAWNKEHPGEMPPLTDQEKYEYFIKDGMPVPGSGATVVSSNKIKLTHEQNSAISKFNESQRTKGFYEEHSSKAKLLLGMPEAAEKEYNDRKLIPMKPYDSHLREKLYDLTMMYDYKGVPAEVVTKVIGFAPEHTYVDGGWTGAVEFFVPTFEAICAYHEINIEFTKSAALIPNEIAKHFINRKVTTFSAVGENEGGFSYTLEWWDKKFKRNLECATKDFSASTKDEMIKIAKIIDRYRD